MMRIKSFAILIFILSLLSCIKKDFKFEKNLQNGVTSYGLTQNNSRIGKWIEKNESTLLRKEIYYGFTNAEISYPEIEKYYYNDKPFLTISYKNNHIQDLSNYDSVLTLEHLPSLTNRLGFDLFYSNCGSCHLYFPNYENNYFGKLVVDKYNSNYLQKFLNETNVLDSNLCLVHPSFNKLDNFELRSIIKYLSLGDSIEILPENLDQ